MRILGTQYTLEYESLDIYISGCKGSPHCSGCHNPESWDFNKGEIYDELYCEKLKCKITSFDDMINNIMIFGGEPLDNIHDYIVKLLLDLIKINSNKKIWLFTRYDINEVPLKIKRMCDYIKCGRYDELLKTDNNIQYGIKLATSNQKIYKL